MTEHNGAQSLIRTLVAAGVDTCFANPGTSEMHFTAALDEVPGMRGVLALFEGVATGAADGYARMAEKPAATLLHLGPGLGNGLANLHNARRGAVPVVNIVGDHAIDHKALDAPLESDIDAVASNVSSWIRRSMTPDDVAADGAAAVAAALGPPGQVATLILPADASWGPASGSVDPVAPTPAAPVPDDRIAAVADVLDGDEPVTLLIGGAACREEGLTEAARVAQASGADLLGEVFPTRLARGAGRPALDRLGYLSEFAEMQLAGARHLVLVDCVEPVAFFAYPGKSAHPVPDDCTVHTLATGGDDVVGALRAVAERLGAPDRPDVAEAARPDRPTGDLDADGVGRALGALLPEQAVVIDEANTSGIFVPGPTAGAPPHDWITLTGGAIGFGLPVATGAAIGARGRRVVSLEADGSAMYTLQALWTQAREELDVTTVILNNSSYAILNMEMARVGADPGPVAASLLDLSGPDLDFVALAQGMGVPGRRVTTGEELCAALEASFAEPGPALIDAVVPSVA